jgi:hypothetical protein
MNVSFFDTFSTVTVSCTPDVICEIGTTIVKNPAIVDGMGEKIVLCCCKFCNGNVLTKFAEIIILEYENDASEKFIKTFSGNKSYSIQSALHELQLSQA